MTSRIAQTALRLIAKKGKSIIYTSVTAGVYDASQSKMMGGSKVSVPIKAVIKDGGSSDLVNGTLVARNEKEFMIAAMSVSFTPESSDIVTLDGFDYSVYALSQEYDGDTVATYTAYAKRA